MNLPLQMSAVLRGPNVMSKSRARSSIRSIRPAGACADHPGCENCCECQGNTQPKCGCQNGCCCDSNNNPQCATALLNH